MQGLIVIPAYFPDKKVGGPISGCRSFAKAVSLNHNLEIVTLDTTNQGYRVSKVDGIKTTYFKKDKGLEWLSKTGWGFSIAFSCWFIKNHKNYDYIYLRALWNYASLFAAIICIFTNQKYIISSSGKFSKFALKRSFLKKLVLTPIVFPILKNSIFIHYSSDYEYKLTPKLISKLTKAITLQTGIEITKKSNLNSKEKESKFKKLIYTVSRFDTIKRIEILSSNIKKLEGDLDVVHIGNYKENTPYFQKIREIYLKNKIDIYFNLNNYLNCKDKKRVFFLGYKDIKEVNNLVNNYSKSIFVQMSFSEGQSNSILEAMARGSICVVSKGCNMDKANNAKAVIITDENNISNDINNIFSKEKKYEELANNQILFLEENHSVKTFADDFHNAVLNNK